MANLFIHYINFSRDKLLNCMIRSWIMQEKSNKTPANSQFHKMANQLSTCYKMRNYDLFYTQTFISNLNILSKILIKKYTKLKNEELAFRYSAPAKLHTQKLEFETLHQLGPIELWDISKMSLLPQIFTLLTNLDRTTSSVSLIQYPQMETDNRIIALLDPNMFPVQDLSIKLHTSESMTILEISKTQRVIKKLRFKLNLRESEDVFLETLPANKRLLLIITKSLQRFRIHKFH